MNPILQLLMSTAWSKGVGDRFGGSQTSDFANLTDMYGAYKRASFGPAAGKQDKPNQPQQSPMDRIKAAFDSLKNMHKGPDQTEAGIKMLAGDDPSPLDNAQWPQGPIGAPSQSYAASDPNRGGMTAPIAVGDYMMPRVGGGFGSAPTQPPMPMARPASAPQPEQPQSPMMTAFQRSAALQRDLVEGGFIDPTGAANAMPNIFKGLFG